MSYLKFVNDIRMAGQVSTGTTVTPDFDPLVAKVIASAHTRDAAIIKLAACLSDSRRLGPHSSVSINGSPTNTSFLRQILAEQTFLKGEATTEWVDSGSVSYSPYAFSVISQGLNTTVQALPERRVGLGIPRSGPMDVVAFKVANILAGNYGSSRSGEDEEAPDALEVVVPTITGTASGKGVKRGGPLALELLFHNEAVVGLAGAIAEVTLDGDSVNVWSGVKVTKGGRLRVGGPVANGEGNGGGLRVYVAVRGGFENIPVYLGSKSTSIGVGGYQVSDLVAHA